MGAPADGLAARDRDPSEFLDSLRFEINSSEVYVFTPAG
jgi:GTP pyrophosphokinase